MLGALLGALLLPARLASAQAVVPAGFSDRLVVGNLDSPVGMAFLPDGRVLVAEQKSAVLKLVIAGASPTVTPLLTVPEVQNSGEEQGLLGIAVDPGWPARAYIYVHYDHAGDSKIRVSRFTVTGDLEFTGDGSLAIAEGSRYDVLTDVPDVANNHNGGTLRFGPDGMLYASFGEDNTPCAAQDTVSLRGVILRLDVSGLPSTAGGPAPKALITPPDNPFVSRPDPNARLVWAYGLRNPFRFHIDPPTGDLYIADVGAARWEEVDRAPSGGLNFGWPHREGPIATGTACSDPNTAFTPPIYAYDRAGAGEASVIGAGLYRRPATGSERFPAAYDGDYFFNDYYTGMLRRLKYDGSSWSLAPAVPGQPSASDWGRGFETVSDWAIGPTGALWYCRQFDDTYQPVTGEIRRIAYTGSTGTPPAPPVAVLYGPSVSPAIGSATLSFNLLHPAVVTLRLYDAFGRRVRTLIDGESRDAGATPVDWDGRDDKGRNAPAGVYVVRLDVEGGHYGQRFALFR